MCNNCGITQGPFYVVIENIKVCKNTKMSPERIKECVERRAKQEARDLLNNEKS